MGSPMVVKVFSQSHETIDDLKDAIRKEVALIPPSMLHKVRENFEKRLESCMANNGAHMPDVIFESYACTHILHALTLHTSV